MNLQIYRSAMIYGCDDPWFGLIAFAVSTLGALLAICYYRIKY